LVLLSGALLTLPLLWASTADAAVRGSDNPPGNNGTVKVEGEALDHLHDNDPHVGCGFFIQWYGFDAGERTTIVTFDAQPPTGTGQGQTLLTDTFSFTGSGAGNALDAQKQYDLTAALAGFTPQPQQGFHVELTVNTDFSHGADTKHKVFWVSPCAGVEAETTTTTTTPSTTTSTPTTMGLLPTTTTRGSDVSGSELLPASPSGASTQRAAVFGTEVARSSALPGTGSGSTLPLALVGLCLVVLGLGLTRVDRSRRARS
jgi:hypothetical protein